MSKYVPLITRTTWDRICDRYHEMLLEGLDLQQRLPFLPIGEPDFGKPDTWSILFCGIAPGDVDGTSITYDDRVEELADHFISKLPDDRAGDQKLDFWSEIALIRDLLRAEESPKSIKIGWANILPINDNPKGSGRQPSKSLISRQQDLAEFVWRDLMTFVRADVIIGTFGRGNFPLNNQFPKADEILEQQGRLWRRLPKAQEPAIIWINHINQRWRDGVRIKASCISALVLQTLNQAS